MGREKSLDRKDVADIRNSLTIENAEALASKYDVSIPTIRSAALGLGVYSKFTYPKPLKKWIRQKSKSHADAKITPAKRESMKKMHAEGMTSTQIASKFKISLPYVSRIIKGDYDA